MSQQFDQTAKRDSAVGVEALQRHVLIADAGSNKTWVIELDASTSELTIRRIGSAGTRDTTAPLITLDLGDIEALGLTNITAKFRLFQFKDSTSCDLYQAAVLMTEPELVP